MPRPPVPDDAPPPIDDRDAPPPPEDETPVGAGLDRPAQARIGPAQAPSPPKAPAAVSWPALRTRLEKVMSMADFSFVGNGDMVSGTVEDGVVTLWAHEDAIKGFIDKQDILKLVADTAGELAGRPCRAQVRVGQPPVAAPVSGDPLDALMGLENVTMT